MARVIAAGDVGHLVRNGATVYCTGMGLAGFAEEAVKAIRESFNATGHPRDLTLYHATGVGNGKDRGEHHFAAEAKADGRGAQRADLLHRSQGLLRQMGALGEHGRVGERFHHPFVGLRRFIGEAGFAV